MTVIYLKLVLIVFWLVFTSVIGSVYAILRWGDFDIDRNYSRFFSWGALKILGLRVEVVGKEHLESQQPCIYVVNHQSGLDMATLGTIYPRRTIVIGKKEVKWIPFFGIFFMAAGNILIDRSKTSKAVAGLSQAVETIRLKGVSIWIFPEGTRNRQGDGILPFKRGAFHMAIQAGVPIVPVVSGCLSPLVSWKEKRIRKGLLRVKILPPIDTKGIKNVDLLAEQTREQMLEAFRSLTTV